MSEKNAILKVEFSSLLIIEEECLWEEDYVDAGELGERIFFSDEFDEHLDEGIPDLTVYLKDDPSISSRVNFIDEVGELFSSRNLDSLRNRA